MGTHLKLHATYFKQVTQTQRYALYDHPLHDFNGHSDTPRNMKTTIFINNNYTNIIISDPEITPEECRENIKQIHRTSPHNTSIPEKCLS